jgi:peptide/nickel transport system permease protein
MRDFIIRRILQIIPTLIISSILIFAVIELAPGDPAAMMLGFEATDEQVEAMREEMGLNRPVVVRYFDWIWDLLHFDMGISFVYQKDVGTTILNAFPKTIQLASIALIIAVGIGFVLGIISAINRNKKLDNIITSLSSISLALPNFWLGIMLIWFISVYLGWLPPSGTGEIEGESWILNFEYIALPVASLAVGQIAVFTRYLRSSMIDVLSTDYIRTARAKGLIERTVLAKHALRNALIPVVTIIGIQFARLLAGEVVIESLFAYTGLGRLVVYSILNRDYPVIQGSLIFVVVLFVTVNLLVDISYGFLDPRIRLTRKG